MIPLFKPYMPEKLPEIDTILHSGALAYGYWGRKFEEKLGDFIGNYNILTVNSYNSAMLVALTVIGIKPNDEIIASPMSCLASNQPIVTLGAKTVWADIDPGTGTLDPDSVRYKITPKTKAIIHNHFCGYVGYVEEINKIGKESGIPVIDDAIEAFGSEYKGLRIGNTGADITTYSFQSVRLPNTIDGGAIAFNNSELLNKALLARDYGINRKLFRDNDGEIRRDCDISTPGYGATLNELNSYIGFVQLQEINELLEKQKQNAIKWENLLINKFNPIRFLGLSSGYKRPNYWVFGILSPNKTGLMKQFKNEGFSASAVHLPNNYYSVFGDKENLSGINKFYSQFFAIPCGWWLE